MLDRFLEHTIQKKIRFYHILRASGTIPASEICTLLHIDPPGISCLIKDLNRRFGGLARIVKNRELVSLHVEDDINTLKLLHVIYASSDVLHCLAFMLTNKNGVPFTKFIDDNFLSKSSAYRTRKTCLEYLEAVGLCVRHNQVCGEEYRIRFLIGLLFYKYGIDCCGIDKASVALARRFILSTNHTIDLDFLEKSRNEYGYFECLLILSWKRRHHPVSFPSPNDFEPLKQLFVYQGIVEHLHRTVEAELGAPFSQADYDYIFAAYCCTNSCVLADKWTLEQIHLLYRIIFGMPEFTDLLERIERKFGINAKDNHAIRAALIYFCKKFILKLQCIVPDKHFYLDSKRNPSTLQVIRSLTKILNRWCSENDFLYPIDPNHIRYFAIQLEIILRQSVKPVQVVVISDLVVELEVMGLVLTRSFPPQQIAVQYFMLNAQNMDVLYELSGCVVLVNHRLAGYIKQLSLSDNNCILSISGEFNSFDRRAVKDAIDRLCDKHFLEAIEKL